jgi:hypothetical protein
MVQLLRALAHKDWATAAAMTSTPQDHPQWTAERFASAFAPFFDEHARVRMDPPARAPANTVITKTGRGTWDVVQVICDDDEANDWALSCFVDLEQSAKEGRPVVFMRGLSRA